MYLVITIDTEEDNWGPTYNNCRSHVYPTKNIERIPLLQTIFDNNGFKPTYLISYPVATNKISLNIFEEIISNGRCEIGVHLHPWNTPPFREDDNENNSFMHNLEIDLQYEKIKTLKDTIKINLGVEALSYRSGRWGFDHHLAVNLYKLGFLVDSSVTPYMDWSIYKGPDYSCVALKNRKIYVDLSKGNESGPYILEIPPTIGYSKGNYSFCNKIDRFLTRKTLRALKIKPILNKLNLVKKLWLSPEEFSVTEMIQLANSVRDKGYKVLNFTFHSNSLLSGLTPFVKSSQDEREFFEKIEKFILFAKREQMIPATLSELFYKVII